MRIYIYKKKQDVTHSTTICAGRRPPSTHIIAGRGIQRAVFQRAVFHSGSFSWGLWTFTLAACELASAPVVAFERLFQRFSIRTNEKREKKKKGKRENEKKGKKDQKGGKKRRRSRTQLTVQALLHKLSALSQSSTQSRRLSVVELPESLSSMAISSARGGRQPFAQLLAVVLQSASHLADYFLKRFSN